MASNFMHARPSPAEVSPLLSLPVDIFAEILQRLPAKDLRNLPSTCKALADNPHVLYALYYEPLRVEDCIEHHFIGAEDESLRQNTDCGKIKFQKFAAAVVTRPDRGQYVQKIAMSHFSTIGEFMFLERHCPNLRTLDLSHISQEYFGQGWTWQELTGSCPTLFERLHFLKVSGEMYTRRSIKTDSTNPSLKNRMAESKDHALTLLLRACPNLETLAISGARGFSWAHADCQRELSHAIVQGAGPHLRKLELWDMATCIRSFRLFLEPLTVLPRLETIAINFHQTLEFFTGGDDSEVEDYAKQRYERTHKGGETDILYASTTKDLRAYLSEIKELVDSGRWDIRSLDAADTEIRHNPRTLYPLLTDAHGLGLLQFMTSHFRWTHPILAWDFISRPSFPFGPSRSLAGMSPGDRRAELKTLARLMDALRALGLAVKVELSALHSRSCVFFESGVASTEDWCFNPVHYLDNADDDTDSDTDTDNLLTPSPEPLPSLGSKIDSLTITYGRDNPSLVRPGRPGHGTKAIWHSRLAQPSPSALAEDVMRFRPFWRSFKHTFPRIQEVRVCVPAYVYRHWSGSNVRTFLPGQGWAERMMCDEDVERVVAEYSR